MAEVPSFVERSGRPDATHAGHRGTPKSAEPLRHYQNVSGGVRYLAWLMNKFHGDLRLVAAAYYAGENIVDQRGLGYSNRDVVSYVASVRERFVRQKFGSANIPRAPRRTR